MSGPMTMLALLATRARQNAPKPEPVAPQQGALPPWTPPPNAAPYMPPAMSAMSPALVRMMAGGLQQPTPMNGGYAPNVAAALARLAQKR